MGIITILTLKEKTRWRDYLQQIVSSDKDVYFTPEYYSLYQNNGDGQALCFIFEDHNDIAVYPFLKNSIQPLGYDLNQDYYDIQGAYGYNGIIATNYSPTFLSSMWDAFDRWCQDNRIVAEFTRFHPLLCNQQWASPSMEVQFSRHTVALNLDSDDIWMNQISSKNRNMIRKAEKEGVIVVESDDYEVFRLLYNSTMKDLHAEEFYFFPQKYYEEYSHSFRGNSMLCLALLNGKVIAGSMFMYSRDYAHYHLSARDRSYSRYAANNLILWYGIQKAKERGCRWLHFGGGTTSDDDDSLLKFKKGFSQTTFNFCIGKRVHNPLVYNKIVEQWKTYYPFSYEFNKVKLLGYREKRLE